ncbi:MAG: Rpn family recombination-promoting nuclease/putative transposase [Oscillospiraceae bacterium]|jgi:predicted transposase/invertase (TIGR01784 family)|nr:Rpn family recombination-promoting nuclease/putative transposase [Oscillospiraceae bacterium]
MPDETHPEIGKVVGLLKELSMDEKVQIMYEAREKARRDHDARIRFAENEGIALGEARGEIRGAERKMREMALNGLRKGYDINVIMDLTGLSVADIQSLDISSPY